jgi:hypothetical protein
MSGFHLPATAFTPEIRFTPALGTLVMRGESYPENVLSFYAPVLEQLRQGLEDQKLPFLQVEMHITYYNSASAKAFQRIFQLLNRAAEGGSVVKLLWHYDEEDDMARDLGNNVREDMPLAAV